MNVHGIDHVGVTVPDIEEATAFFRTALSARVLYDTLPRDQGPRGGPSVEEHLGVPEGTRELAVRMLKLPNGPGLELFEFAGPRQREAALPCDLGWQHVAVYVRTSPRPPPGSRQPPTRPCLRMPKSSALCSGSWDRA